MNNYNKKGDSKTKKDKESKKDVLGELMDRLEVQAETISKIHGAVYEDPKNIGNWMDLAVSDISQGEYSNALVALEKALEIDPNNIDALLLLGQMCLRLRLTRGFDDLVRLELYPIEIVKEVRKTLRGVDASIDFVRNRIVDGNMLALECFDKVLDLEGANSSAEKGRSEAIKALVKTDKSYQHLPKNHTPEPWRWKKN